MEEALRILKLVWTEDAADVWNTLANDEPLTGENLPAVLEWARMMHKEGLINPANQAENGETFHLQFGSGKVGMIGTSYNGTLPLAAATTGDEGLEAINPIAPNTSYYHYYRSNGLVRSPGGYLGEDVDVLYDFIGRPPTETEERDARAPSSPRSSSGCRCASATRASPTPRAR